MAWVTPPTFGSADILTASNLNILSDDIELLHGYTSGVMPAMVSTTITNDGDILHAIRHSGGTALHFKYRATDDCKVYYDATLVFHDGVGSSSPITQAVDIGTASLTAGTFYTLKFTMAGTDNRTVYYAYESNS